jgi:sulfoxide reductase heme-binding subunit YedZ
MIKLIHSIPLLYIAMLVPGRFAILGLFDRNWYYGQMMYDSGVWSVRLLLLTIAVTPILLVINWTGFGRPLGRWLLQRRRHFGLASFIYATLHLAHYTIETASAEEMLLDALRLEFAVGWLALMIFAVLAATSNASSVRALGRGWKRVHYWIYPAIALTFLHWYLFDRFTERVLFWLMIFVALKASHGALRAMRQARAAR